MSSPVEPPDIYWKVHHLSLGVQNSSPRSQQPSTIVVKTREPRNPVSTIFLGKIRKNSQNPEKHFKSFWKNLKNFKKIRTNTGQNKRFCPFYGNNISLIDLLRFLLKEIAAFIFCQVALLFR